MVVSNVVASEQVSKPIFASIGIVNLYHTVGAPLSDTHPSKSGRDAGAPTVDPETVTIGNSAVTSKSIGIALSKGHVPEGGVGAGVGCGAGFDRGVGAGVGCCDGFVELAGFGVFSLPPTNDTTS